MRMAWLLVVLGAVGCVDSSSVRCADGTTCPTRTTCVALSETETLCATKPQLAACDGLGEGDACTFDNAPGECTGGACVPVVCGDGKVGLGEVCDDGDTTSGNGCSADCLSKETCGNGIVDPIRIRAGMVALPNEQCDDGNLVSGDGCSSNCKIETPRWSLVDAPLGPRASYSLTYDSARKRIVMFGGYVSGPGYFSDVYEWTGTTWVRASPAVSPQPRGHAMLAYDPKRQRAVLFGGTPGGKSSAFGDTWEWDGERWVLAQPATSPPGRASGGMVYDPSRKKIVLFGGWSGQAALNDLWEWDGTDWKQVTASGTAPTPRAGHLMGYDPVKGRIVIAGGNDGSAQRTDTFELANGAWKLLATNGPAELGGGQAGSTVDTLSGMAYERAGARFIAYAKTAVGNSKTLAFDGAVWSDLGTAAPGDLTDIELVADGTTGTIYTYGGLSTSTTTWAWNGSSWSAIAIPARPGVWRLSASASDPEHGRGWIFGGQNTSSQAVAELASFDGSTWTRYTASGPSARYGAQLAYDRKRQRLVLFGGKPDSGPALADTWVFDGTNWSAPPVSMSPPPRFGGSMVYDTKREKVVLFGGFDGTTLYNDTWEWNGATWTKVTTTHAPDPRVLPMATFDAARGVTILANGFTPTPEIFNDAWTYDGTDWKLVQAPTPLVSRVYNTCVAFDAVSTADALFGGIADGGLALDDTWAWNGDWHLLVLDTSPQARGYSTGFQAPNGAGIDMHGGFVDVDSPIAFDETWRLRYERDEARENCFVPVDNDGDGLVGCADPDCWYVCTPACPPGAACDATAPKCGDGTCSAVENCRMCPADCTCTAVCGDGFCDAGETQASCPGDCTP